MCWGSSCSCASCMQNRVENAPPFHLPASLVGDDHGDWPKGVCGERLWSLYHVIVASLLRYLGTVLVQTIEKSDRGFLGGKRGNPLPLSGAHSTASLSNPGHNLAHWEPGPKVLEMSTNNHGAVNCPHPTLRKIDNATRIDTRVLSTTCDSVSGRVGPGTYQDIGPELECLLHACLGYLWRDTRWRLKARCCVWISAGT